MSAVLEIQDILKLLPHRYPILLVDKITEANDERIIGYKNISISEPIFLGHFPDNPIYPGVYILEGLAQAGGVGKIHLLRQQGDDFQVYYLGIDKARFRKPVLPGDVLRYEITNLVYRRNTAKFQGKAYVDDKLVAEAEIMAMIQIGGDK